MDGAGVVVRWNRHAERILGLGADQAIGRPWAGLFSVVRGEDIAGSEVRAAAMKPGGWHGRTQLGTGPTSTVWVQAHVQAIKKSPRKLHPAWPRSSGPILNRRRQAGTIPSACPIATSCESRPRPSS